MPKTGKMFADKIVLPGYRLPEEYRWVSVYVALTLAFLYEAVKGQLN